MSEYDSSDQWMGHNFQPNGFLCVDKCHSNEFIHLVLIKDSKTSIFYHCTKCKVCECEFVFQFFFLFFFSFSCLFVVDDAVTFYAFVLACNVHRLIVQMNIFDECALNKVILQLIRAFKRPHKTKWKLNQIKWFFFSISGPFQFPRSIKNYPYTYINANIWCYHVEMMKWTICAQKERKTTRKENTQE